MKNTQTHVQCPKSLSLTVNCKTKMASVWMTGLSQASYIRQTCLPGSVISENEAKESLTPEIKNTCDYVVISYVINFHIHESAIITAIDISVHLSTKTMVIMQTDIIIKGWFQDIRHRHEGNHHGSSCTRPQRHMLSQKYSSSPNSHTVILISFL